MNKIDLIKPHLFGKEREYVMDAIDSNWIAPLGPYVERFENAVAKYVKAKYAVAVNTGTAAIHCALLAAGVGPGDKVAVADITFIASVNPVRYVGADPVFVDCEWESYNIDPVALDAAAQRYKLKAVIVPHFYGMPADMEKIVQVCRKHGIIIIEDAAESLGSTYHGRQTGVLGDIGCFSFNGNKIITASCGGMVVTNNKEYADRAFHYATQAKESVPFYRHDDIGFNYRMSNITAALGLAQFETLNERVALKNMIFHNYTEKLDPGIRMVPNIVGRRSNRWLSCGVLEKPIAVDLVKYLNSVGVESRRVWFPLHRQPPYKGTPYIINQCGEYTASDYMFFHGICLPSSTGMTDDEHDYVCAAVNSFLKGAGRA